MKCAGMCGRGGERDLDRVRERRVGGERDLDLDHVLRRVSALLALYDPRLLLRLRLRLSDDGDA